MEEDIRSELSVTTAPSVDPLDLALERLERARSAANNQKPLVEDDELDVDDDEMTETGTTSDDEPEDEFEDDDELVVANTPDSDDADDDDTLQESQKKVESKKKPSKPEAQKKTQQGSDDDDDEDDAPKLSRKQRGKLIAELRQTLEDEQRQRAELEKQLAAQKEDDEKLNKEIDRALGTQEEYERAVEDGLAGDTTAGEKARIWKANREFYKKLLTRADKEARQEFMNYYWKDVQGLPGITQQVLQASTLSEILKNVYDAAVNSVGDDSNKKIEALQEELTTLKGQYRALKAKSGGTTKRSPMGGGGDQSGAETTSTDWRKKYIDPKTGLFTDEADALIARYGVEVLTNPKLIKAR